MIFSFATKMYQRKQHELLDGLRGIESVTDDILLGCDEDENEDVKSEHDANLPRCRSALGRSKLRFKDAAI